MSKSFSYKLPKVIAICKKVCYSRHIVNLDQKSKRSKQNQKNIGTRSATYMTKIYSDQLKANDPYTKAKKVIVINILNFNYFKRNSYHSVARMKFEKSKESAQVEMGYIEEEQYATDDLEMHFIELPKFKKKNPDISSKLAQWLWLMCGEEEKIEMAKNKNEEIEKAKEELEKLAMNAEEREMYELRIKAIRDEMNIRESGYEDGEKAGKAKGIAVGKATEKMQIAKSMLKENMDLETIKRITGLTQKEIEKLK